jgi:hypothetical protein
MLTSDLLLGFVISKLFDNKGETRSPAVTFPPAPGAPPAAPPTTTTAPPTAQPPTAQPPAFPTGVQVPPAPTPAQPSAVPAGFKKAIEVWIVKPSIAAQAGQVLGGAPQDVQVMGAALTLQALENQFPSGWQGATSATAAEAMQAKALLAKWKDGGVVFSGPSTLTGRRAFRMTKHPAGAVPGATPPAPVAPAAAPPAAAPPATVPASFPTPAPAPAPAPRPSAPAPVVTTLPEVLITADAPTAPSVAPGRLVTAVRKGEGLANVAKRLGRPATGASAVELQQANVPQGPDATWTKTDLSKGGLKKANRAGGLQPGDRLFVPASWGPVDVSRL